jgi:glycosyltransferase involved in cell wall biosynthesis
MSQIAHPNLSVIIAVRNGARFLVQALESVFRQKHPAIQVIVVDGQSTDGSERIAQSYSGVVYVRQETLGLARARNLGLQLARGEFVAFLDHDDLWSQNKLDIQLSFMHQHPHISYTTTHFEWFDDSGNPPPPHDLRRQHTGPQAAPTPGTLIARRSAFEQNGLFAVDLTVACDSEWFARARRRGIASASIPHVLLRKRLHDANLSAHVERYRLEWFQVLKSLNTLDNVTSGLAEPFNPSAL